MKTLKRISIVTLCMILVIASSVCPAAAKETEPTPKKFIKWMTFSVPYEALVKAKGIDIKSQDSALKINWVDLLSYLGAKHGGNVVEAFGWNRYGGWRIGIRSFNKKRSYYYAHLRKNHPYAKDLKQGQIVKAGDVIGYLGMTGYSYKENANNMT
jgi:hypothetical protein